MRFIPSSITDPEAPGADAEAAVFNRLKAAFEGDQDGIGFYKFPIVDKAGKRFSREPDFVILHQKYGLVIIEVKGYQIDHIDDIIGQNWLLQGMSQDEARPFAQARDQGLFIQSHFMREPELVSGSSCVIPVNGTVALPNISQEEWQAAGHDTNPATRVLLAEDLTPQSLRDEFSDLPDSGPIAEDEYLAARAVLTGGEVVSQERGEVCTDPETKHDYYQRVKRGLKSLDEQQEDIGIAIPPGPQQIRGIAGSGKTVLLAMKAAAMHVKYPEWNIVFTFNTRSLYDAIESLVDRFVAHFSDENRGENLKILHGWGGETDNGLYYELAQAAGVPAHDVNSARAQFGDKSPAELLGEACQDLVNNGVPECYDAILIDEGQDFEPGFYTLCYNALTEDKRLIWAYDEAQNLTNLTAPTPSQIFGADQELLPEELDLTGQYEGGILKSQVMRRSYRAPRQAVMTAHTLGMALKNPDAEVPRITQQSGWNDIGYEIEGDFRAVGEPVELRRPEEFSPHPLQDTPEAGPFVRFERFDSRDDELEFVAESICSDIEDENMAPEEILVIPLGDPGDSRDLGLHVRNALGERDIKTNIAWQGDVNIFSRPNRVTIARINRAKGNEAAQVYILNLEAVERDTWKTNPINNRNELFVALTRARGWCTVTGTGETDSVFVELQETIEETTEPDPVVTFPAPPRRDIDIGPDSNLPSVSQSQLTDHFDLDTEANDTSSQSGGYSVACPVDGCEYEGPPSSVAAHISGTHDEAHDWGRLTYSGASEFKEQHSRE